jgi:branched-chain amino acid transport system permease protein
MKHRTALTGSGLLVVALSLPFWFIQTQFILTIATLSFIYMSAAIAWNIISGYGGQTSFGHSIFFGIGAYAPALFFSKIDVNTWVDIVIGAVIAAIVAVLLGLLTFRTRGIYFALATFALTLVFQILAVHFDGLTGGAVGLTVPTGANGFAQFRFGNKLWYYYAAIVLASIILVISYLVHRSALGLKLRAVRDDQEAARASGVRVFRVKLIALALSGFLTAFAGAMYFEFVGFIDPTSAFGATIATQIALLAIVGGAGTLWGPVLGAAVFVPLQQVLQPLLSAFPAGFNLVIYAVIVILILWLNPKGLLAIVSGGISLTIDRIKRIRNAAIGADVSTPDSSNGDTPPKDSVTTKKGPASLEKERDSR